jgi:diguanylate cyclase (GGDEF)-like protein
MTGARPGRTKRPERIVFPTEELQSSEGRYRDFVEHSPEAIWCADMAEPVRTDLPAADQVAQFVAHGRLVECNSALATMLGRSSAAEVDGPLLARMVGQRNTKVLLEAWIRARYRLVDFDVEVGVGAGTTRWLSVSMTGVVEDGAVRRLWGICHDITGRRAELRTLEYETQHDGLTGLPNRAHFMSSLQATLDESKRSGSTFGVLLIDLDHFKEVNDTLGHYAGDHMLRAIGPRLRSGLDPGRQLMARLGGDEFAVILKDFQSFDELAEVASSLLVALRAPFVVDGAPLEIGASIGGATYPADGTDGETLLRRADIAMYLAKRTRRGYAAYRANEDPHTPRQLELLSELSAAIKARQIVLHFQPKVDLVTGAMAGFEVLSRWPHPRHGMVPPAEFIVLAEMGDVIRVFTSLVIDSTFTQWNDWASKGYDSTFAINISARSLADDGIVEELRRALDRRRVPPGRIELEITERAFMIDPEQTLTRWSRMTGRQRSWS